MAFGLGESQRVINFTQQGRSINLYNRNTGGYPSAGYTTPALPTNATKADKEVMSVPLISIAVDGSNPYVTDAIGKRILKYNKSGNYQSGIGGAPVACGLPIRFEWQHLGRPRAQQRRSVYSSARVKLATPITDLIEVRALSI